MDFWPYDLIVTTLNISNKCFFVSSMPFCLFDALILILTTSSWGCGRRESLPFLQTFKHTVSVVKLGGISSGLSHSRRWPLLNSTATGLPLLPLSLWQGVRLHTRIFITGCAWLTQCSPYQELNDPFGKTTIPAYIISPFSIKPRIRVSSRSEECTVGLFVCFSKPARISTLTL